METENNEEEPKKRKVEFDDAELDTPSIDLGEDLDSKEEPLLPPEEESEAREMNVGTFFACVFIFIAVIIMIVMLFGGKRKGDKKNKELDKAGSKYEVDFEKKISDEQAAVDTFSEIKTEEEKPEDIEKEIESLPEFAQPPKQGEPGTAPVAAVGSGSYKSERPDTRNSKSPRKIEGLKGQASPAANQNIVNAMINGNGYTAPQQNQPPSKEEYIAQMLKQSSQMRNQMYGSSGGPDAFQQNKEAFYSSGTDGAGSGQYMPFNSLWDGTIISGALVTAINTDNPGVVIARVTENVYSSYDNTLLLIPEGSTLYATYNSSVSYGQNKVQVAWNLLIRPDGYRIVLGNMNGVDKQGASGYKGFVNNHPWETLKALGLIAVYSLINTEAMKDMKATNNDYMKNMIADVYAQGSKIGNKMIDRALDIKPTIKIKAGTEIKLITNTPLELPPVQINPVTRRYVRVR